MKKFLVTFLFICCSVFLCQIPNAIADNPPVIGDGPFLAAGSWPVLPTNPATPMILDKNYRVLWTFSDDFASCSDDCTHKAQYRKYGNSTWNNLDEIIDPVAGYVTVELPVEDLANGVTYEFRITVKDCANQETVSRYYYFKPWYDKPPVFTGGPFLAAGSWPVLPTNPATPMILNKNYSVLWTFSDDFASCSNNCKAWAYYKGTNETYYEWRTLTPTIDQDQGYAYGELPVNNLKNNKYEIYFYVRDCANQTTISGPYYFGVIK